MPHSSKIIIATLAFMLFILSAVVVCQHYLAIDEYNKGFDDGQQLCNQRMALGDSLAYMNYMDSVNKK